jgi:hypothetical protein
VQRFIAIVALFVCALATSGCSKPNPGPPTAFRPASGSLELCVLANDSDDADALFTATDFFATAKNDLKIKNELHRRAIRGEAPPPPAADPNSAFVVFEEDCTYRWAPVSGFMLRELGIDTEPQAGEFGRTTYAALKDARDWGDVHMESRPGGERELTQIWWSRECPPEREGLFGVEYFLLVRETPAKFAIQADELEVEWLPHVDQGHQINFRCDGDAPDRLAKLTTLNKPGRDARNRRIIRCLAILIRGKVVAAPTLNEPITQGYFKITMGKNDLQATKGLLDALRGE